jgi:hypothetical protein
MVSNMTPAQIQDNIDDAPNGGVVFIPSGSYKLTTPLLIDGKENLVIYSNGIAGFSYNGTGPAIVITDSSNLSMENIFVSFSEDNADNGVSIEDSSGLRLINFRVWGAQNHQLYMTGSWSVYTENCLFDCLGADAAYSGFYHGPNSNNILHVRSRFVGRAACNGAYIKSGAGINFQACDFSGSVSGSSNGLVIEAVYGLNVIGCYFEWNGQYAVHVGNSESGTPIGVNIIGNYFNLNDNENNIGVYVEYNSGYVTISENTMLGNDATGADAILISDDENLNNIVVGDQFIYGAL